jgi:hypothetical protein
MRRERINARLKILQELIPNGKKVDISTMLDEAVQYVKFLHMQIKVCVQYSLFSDECGCFGKKEFREFYRLIISVLIFFPLMYSC